MEHTLQPSFSRLLIYIKTRLLSGSALHQRVFGIHMVASRARLCQGEPSDSCAIEVLCVVVLTKDLTDPSTLRAFILLSRYIAGPSRNLGGPTMTYQEPNRTY